MSFGRDDEEHNVITLVRSEMQIKNLDTYMSRFLNIYLRVLDIVPRYCNNEIKNVGCKIVIV